MLWDACLRHLSIAEKGPWPFGCLVATAIIKDCIPSEKLLPDIYGNYSPNRFGWILSDVEKLAIPRPVRGSQGFFQIPMPAAA